MSDDWEHEYQWRHRTISAGDGGSVSIPASSETILGAYRDERHSFEADDHATNDHQDRRDKNLSIDMRLLERVSDFRQNRFVTVEGCNRFSMVWLAYFNVIYLYTVLTRVLYLIVWWINFNENNNLLLTYSCVQINLHTLFQSCCNACKLLRYRSGGISSRSWRFLDKLPLAVGATSYWWCMMWFVVNCWYLWKMLGRYNEYFVGNYQFACVSLWDAKMFLWWCCIWTVCQSGLARICWFR